MLSDSEKHKYGCISSNAAVLEGIDSHQLTTDVRTL